MRIHELNLIRYGKFTDRSLNLPFKDCDIHLIVGPNEAGKSTIRSAISDWLFGFPTRTPMGFLHPNPELRIGGVIEKKDAESADFEKLSFNRIKRNINTLRTADDGILADSLIKSWLGNINAQAFTRMYGLDHTTLVDGGAGILSASDDIGRMLFQSASGIKHLGDALQKLLSEADTLWAPRRSSNRAYYKALETYDAAHHEFKKATLRTRDWRSKHNALAAIEAQLIEVKNQDVELRQKISRLERTRRVRPLLSAIDTARTQRTELLSTGDVQILDEDAEVLFVRAVQEISLATFDISRLTNEVAEIQEAMKGIAVDRNILALSEEITELNERRLQFRAHRSDMVKHEDGIRLEWTRVQDMARGLSWKAENEIDVRNRLPGISARSRLTSLINSRTALALELKNAKTSYSDRLQEIEKAETALLQLTAYTVDSDLSSEVDQAMILRNHDNEMLKLQNEIDGLTIKIEDAMKALGTWRRPLESLRSTLVPDEAHIQSLINQHKADIVDEETIIDALDDKNKEISQLGLDLQQFVRNYLPVSSEQVFEMRRTRDNSWQEIKQAPKPLLESYASFEGQIIQADQLADSRLERAQAEADRQSKADALEHKQREHTDLAKRASTVKHRMMQRITEWGALTTSCGLPELPLEMALTWLQLRHKVLDLAENHSSAEQDRNTQLTKVKNSRERLWKLLGREDTAPELNVCLSTARDLIKQVTHADGQRNSLDQQIRDCQLSLGSLKGALDTAQVTWDEWNDSWKNALLKALYAADTPIDQVVAELDVMQKIDGLLNRIRSIRSDRIETMQVDLDGLADTAARLSIRVAADLCELSPEEISLELSQRLHLSNLSEAATNDLLNRLKRSQADLTKGEQRLQSVEARLAPLMATTGIEDVTLLGRAIERSDERREIEGRIRSSEQELTHSADGLSLNEIREESTSIRVDELMEELERQKLASQEVVNRIASLSNEYGSQKIEFEAFDGSAKAARAEAQRQEAISAMTNAAEQYLRLQTASRLLKWSIEKFRETKQGPMLAKASAIFNGLSLNSFSRLLVDSEGDTPRLFGIRPSGQQVDVSGMSEGSRDQLFLALRLSALELHVEQGINMPLIADDLFINFDDQRTAAGFKALGGLSRNMQVVYLTHHDHLVPLAKEVLGGDLNVIYL